jgi:hypothetical protein
MPATISLVRGASRPASIWFAEVTAVGALGLKPPPVERGAPVVVTSPGCAKWSPFASTHGYSAQPCPPLGFMKPTSPVASCVTYRP